MSEKLHKWFCVFFVIVSLLFTNSCKKDNTPPVITILGNNPYIYCMASDFPPPYEDPGATALDDEDGDITTSINTSSNVNIAVTGIYKVTYTVEDKAGNATTATREVNVMYCK
jgi:hypothetical protein